MEAAVTGSLLRGYIERDATHVAEKFAANVGEIIVRAIEIVAVNKDHPGKACRLVLEFEGRGKSTQQLALHAPLAKEVAAGLFAVEVQSPKEIVVVNRSRSQFRVRPQILQVCLN